MTRATVPLVCLGNAIVDVIGVVEEDFLAFHGLPKGVFRPVDAAEAARVQAALPAPRAVPGGSAANTAAVAAALAVPVSFIGKVGDDPEGALFAAGMREAGVAVPVGAAPGLPTSRCVVAVTPDGERSMSTHLGACQSLCTAEVDAGLCAEAGFLFLEGYAWSSDRLAAPCRTALRAARDAGRRVAVTVSDPSIAKREAEAFLGLAEEGEADLFFANRAEALALTGTGDVGSAVEALRARPGTWVVTLSGDGCLVVREGRADAYPAHPATVVDTTGAGDAFAGGFLAALCHGMGLGRAAGLASFCAAHVIARVGARPDAALADLCARLGHAIPRAGSAP